MRRVYQVSWTERFSTAIAPEVAHREFQRIERLRGAVTPDALVEASRPPEAPLHELFEWDDSRAADEWRHAQARQAISALRVVVRVGEPPVPAMAYVAVARGGDQHDKAFIPMVSVVDDQARRDQFLRGELRNVEGCLQRTAAFREMEPLRDALEEVKAELVGRVRTTAAAD